MTRNSSPYADPAIRSRCRGAFSLTIPNDRGFALIGDTNPGDIVRRDLRLCHYSPHRRDHCRPDFLRIMLDVARRRIDLTQLFLRGGERPERCVERDGPRRSRALVDCDESRRQIIPERANRRLP